MSATCQHLAPGTLYLATLPQGGVAPLPGRLMEAIEMPVVQTERVHGPGRIQGSCNAPVLFIYDNHGARDNTGSCCGVQS